MSLCHRSFFFFVVLLLPQAFGSSVFANATQTSTAPSQHARSHLVSVEWLKQNLQREDLLLIDTSVTPRYRTKHIAGAAHVDAFGLMARPFTLAQMQARMQSWGLDEGKTVVLYDEGASFMASTVFFELVLHGFPARILAILDGGLAKWEATGGATTSEVPAPRKPGTAVSTQNDAVLARLPAILSASGDPSQSTIIDALDADYYYGGARFFTRGGHIPNAISLPNPELFNSDKTFKSEADLRRHFATLGIQSDRQIITYCGGGAAATLPFFVAKYLLGFPRVSVFKGSQREWLRDERGLPLWTYPAPMLLRDAAWVNGWNADMIRMMGAAGLGIIDIRSADEFAKGHVPYAVNLPAETLFATAKEPTRLSEMLGKAGISSTDPAVIVSAGGLNPDSALALLALEALGHEKVSVLLGSADDWALTGLPVAKPGAPNTAAKVLRPTQYVQKPAKPMLVSANSPTGAMTTRVYLDAGDRAVAATRLPSSPAGQRVHVPYRSLVSPNGTPKSAMEIWSALSKAGVSRTAEVVSVAENLGDAAVMAVLLRLMGFPNVKVMALATN